MTQRIPIPDLGRLAMSQDQVSRLPRSQRELRVVELVRESHSLLDVGIANHIIADNRSLRGVVTLFSGGNDSTVLAHVFKGRSTHAAHANTGVGIEQTRQYVRDVCADWGLPLLERKPPREDDSYRAQVLMHGFPGPGRHARMYQRLKERALGLIATELVLQPLRQRVVYLAGRRRTESSRRANVPELERWGSVVFVSPLVNWTKPDMNTYRIMTAKDLLPGGRVPVNEVSDLIHMSGECLCGAFASYNERDMISEWYPEAFFDIEELQKTLASYSADFIHPRVLADYRRGTMRYEQGLRKTKPSPPKPIPAWAKVWGWSGDPELLKKSNEKPVSGRLCSSCDAKWHESAIHA